MTSYFFKGLLGKLKQNGKSDTEHYDCLTNEEMEKFWNFLKIVYKLMQIDENHDDFQAYYSKIPKVWKEQNSPNESYNYLAMYGAMCIMVYQVLELTRKSFIKKM